MMMLSMLLLLLLLQLLLNASRKAIQPYQPAPAFGAKEVPQSGGQRSEKDQAVSRNGSSVSWKMESEENKRIEILSVVPSTNAARTQL